jgi:hypothetical protein
MEIIKNHPDLFEAVSPINVEHLLVTHPNHPFVDLVCVALCEGFWPWAHTQKDSYLTTWDNSSFGKGLMPGMYNTPVHAIPKPHSIKLQLINDHSARNYSLNSMIVRDDITGCRLDTVSDLITSLIHYHQKFGKKCLILFKSDVAMAY